MLPFISAFAHWAVRTGDTPAQAVALANLAFNAGVALAFLPWTAWMGRRFAPPGTPPASPANLAV